MSDIFSSEHSIFFTRTKNYNNEVEGQTTSIFNKFWGVAFLKYTKSEAIYVYRFKNIILLKFTDMRMLIPSK